MKKIILIILTTFVLVSCAKEKPKEKYSDVFYETFDTQIQYLEYSKSEQDYKKNYKFVEEEYKRLHKLYDNYRNYEGINNVKTINDNAGKQAIKVDDDLFNLIKFSIDNYDKTLGKLNIAMGSVLEIWHDVREKNLRLEEGKKTQLPDENKLKEASKHMKIKAIELNEKEKTVYINDPNVKIDLGATAKGYATELVAKKLEEKGIKHASINAGGNVRTIGTPGDGRSTWGIALQNPDLNSSEYLDVLFIQGTNSVVTSGDYQRFFMHEGKKYHHLIDPQTLYPANKYNSVSVLTRDSGIADVLSTALYLSTKEEAEKIIKNYEEEVGVVWSNESEGKTNTPNMDKLMKSKGAKSK